MTDKCREKVANLDDNLSVEALILAAIMGTDIETVQFILDNTDWEKEIDLYKINEE